MRKKKIIIRRNYFPLDNSKIRPNLPETLAKSLVNLQIFKEKSVFALKVLSSEMDQAESRLIR
jgi:hypothetical protein